MLRGGGGHCFFSSQTGTLKLTPDEIRFFRDEGYVIKRKVMDENLMAQARERLWDKPPPGIDRNDPNTWRGPIQTPEDRKILPRSPETDYLFDGWALPNPPSHNDQYSGVDGICWRYRTLGTEKFLVRMLLTDASIWGMAEQLLGKGSLAVPSRTRGIYCRFPQRDIPVEPLKPHTDGHEFHLGVVGFIDDVPPNGGGFTIFPKSHRVFYYQHLTQFGRDKTDTYEKHHDMLKEQTATECSGEAGDIILFHHRLAHAGNPPNHSLEIRKAALGDLVRKDLKDKLDEPPCENMWRDWPGIPTDG
jgi:hypothetical protein